MHTRIDRPDQITRAELDRYLADGWYRVGQIMMTCRFVLNDTGLRSAVWTRVPLEAWELKKSHRRLLSRVDRSFRLVEGPVRPDALREALYQRYLTRARGERASNLMEILGGGWEGRFDTREIAMWEGDRLIGFSWFDIGGDSLQSLIAVYDPDYRQMSLGFTTLLLEIREALRRGLKYHYAGYVLPGDPSMDYKLRTRPIEFLDAPTGLWLPWEQIDLTTLPAERVRSQLDAARRALTASGIPARPLTYDSYGLRSERLPQLFGEPLALDLSGKAAPRMTEVVVWDLDRKAFRVQQCARAWAQRVGADGQQLDPVKVWVVVGDVAVAEDSKELIDKIERRGRGYRFP